MSRRPPFMHAAALRAIAPVLLLIGLVAGVAGAVSAAAPQVVGIAAAIVNDVRIKGAGARQFGKAALRQRVALADQVETGGGSRMQLLLLDKSQFTVGANARLTIDRFVYDPNGGSMSASVAKGAFRFMSGRSGSSRQVSSPAATIGIRGTLFDGVVGEQAVAIARGERELRGAPESDPATATLVVLRGPGPMTQGRVSPGAVDVSAAGETVTLDRPLLAAYVPRAGAAPIGPFTLSNPGVARLNDLLLEPKALIRDPDAPGQPYMPPPERRDPYYDGYPPPGGFRDGPGPRGGGYGAPAIPGLNGMPGSRGTPPVRDTPRQPTGQATPTPTPTQTPGASGRSPASPAPSSGSRLYLPANPSPQTGPSPSPNDVPGTSATRGYPSQSPR